MSHRCLRCGASCQGLAVRVEGEERARIAEKALELGVERPFSGPFLRQNWGTCVFYADGCRLHASFGAEAKPAVCRQFPELGGRAIDPACLHPGEVTEVGEVWAEWADLAIGRALAGRLRALPFDAVRKPRLLGSITAEALEGLERAEPVVPEADAAYLHWAASAALPSVDHHPDARVLLVGGGQLLCGLGRGGRYAAWVRLLRQVRAL